MVQSITVIGGTSSGNLTGLVTVPLDNASPSGFVNSLQALLGSNGSTGYSDSVNAGALYLNNLNVAGINGAVAFGANNTTVPGILELTNTDSTGSVHSGSANISGAVPSNYSTLIVQAPGGETISGNGSNNFLAVFGGNSSVNFNAPGGSGTVVASGNDNLALGGGVWSVVGGDLGNNVLITNASSVSATLNGAGNSSAGAPSNQIGSYSQNLSVLSNGTNDFIITAAGQNTVTVTGFANVSDYGAADTVYATGSGSVNMSFGSQGGTLDFINQSTSASKVNAQVDPATGLITSPGSVTVFGGAGGGVYNGGHDGNNSLVGGSGVVTLYGAGMTNYLYADGAAAGGQQNYLNAVSGTNDTLIAGSGTTNNTFAMGTGTDIVSTNGSGLQVFAVGTSGSETLTGSTVAGANNVFLFDQTTAQGGGTDIITNFASASGAEAYINFFGQSTPSVTIAGFGSIVGGYGAFAGTEIALSNGTTIKLLGVSASSFNSSIVGGTTF
ncbi:MAG: hypothetical protein P4L54_05425 [Acidocella sp.]|nr:hypothetical protein [Acidocella sp.]